MSEEASSRQIARGSYIAQALGEGAHAKVEVHLPPTPRIPLQRPARAEHFTGREKELTRLLEDLQPGKVVTLAGPGGIGKTALAAEAIWTLAPGEDPPERFPDGIIFHSFYNQREVDLALEKVALAYGEQPRPTPWYAAQRALGGRRALLILDGAEDADDLQSMLEIRDRCCALVTSRSHKDAAAGRQDIRPLPLDEGIHLLQAWARERATDRTVVEQICQLVGGLPLALRLVGRYLTETEEDARGYLEWLERTPLEALDHGLRRQESVPILLERSLEKLSAAARQVLGSVGVLALAPFRQQVILAGTEMTEWRVKQTLGELVNYGLLQRGENDYEVSHALIRTYIRMRIPAAAESIRKIASYYTALAEAESQKGLEGFARLNNERVHILYALHECESGEEWEYVRQLALAVDNYLDLSGYWTEWLTTLKAGLAATRALKDRQGEGVAFGSLGLAYLNLGQIERAIEYFEQALAISHEIGDRRSEGSHLGNLGLAYGILGQVERAIEYFEQALAIAREIGDRRNEGSHLGNLGIAYYGLGLVDRAIEHSEQALAIAREIGDRRGEGRALGYLGNAYRDLGPVKRAVEYLEQALAIAREIGDRRGEGYRLDNLGLAYFNLGQVDRAIEHSEQALAIAREIGDRYVEGSALGGLGLAYLNLGQIERAIEYFEQAQAIAREIGDRRGEGACLGGLGRVYADLGQVQRAIEHLEQALAIAREIGDRRGESYRLRNLGSAYSDLGQVERAIEHYEQALEIARQIGHRLNEGRVLGNLGNACRKLGQVQRAIEHLEQALAIAREIGDRYVEGSALGGLGSAYSDLGQVERAIELYEQALEIFIEIRSPHAEWARSRLAELKA